MRELSQEWSNALAASGIQTAMAMRLEFLNETLFIWTGSHSIQVSNTGDPLLDGHTFDPLVAGAVVQIGDNAYSYSGSEAFTVSLGIPSDLHPEIAAAQVYPTEYLARPAYLWRTLIVSDPTTTAPAQMQFRRIRSGSMDKISVARSRDNSTFSLTIESFASFVGNASNSTYQDQKTKFDPTDISQDYSTQIANGESLHRAGVTKITGLTGLGSVFNGRFINTNND